MAHLRNKNDMASPKVGYGLPTGSVDGPRIKRVEGERSLRAVPRSMVRPSQNKAMGRIKPIKPGTLHSRLPSRVFASSPTRPPSDTSKSLKSATDRPPKSSGSTTSSSWYSGSHSQTESGSSTSSRSFDCIPRLGQPHTVLGKRSPSISYDAESFYGGFSGLRSSSPKPSIARGSLGSSQNFQLDRGITKGPHLVEEQRELVQQAVSAPILYPELDRYRNREQSPSITIPYQLATHDLPPPTPGSLLFSANSSQLSTLSGSPSTRVFESPGPGLGPYSRDTTPTSISSQSPGLVSSSRGFTLSKTRLHSPALSRPPVTRRRTSSISNEVDLISVDPHGLAAVRESVTSSSSNSTVREAGRMSKQANRPEMVVPESPPASPPPRRSLQRLSVGKEEGSPPQLRRQTQRLVKPEVSSSPPKPPSHARVPQALSPKLPRPSRPTRDEAPLSSTQQPRSPVPIVQSNLPLRSSGNERRGSEPAAPHPIRSPPFPQPKSASTSHLPTGKDDSVLRPPARLRGPSVVNPPLRSGTPGPSGPASTIRFAMFSRRRKAAEHTEAHSHDDKRESLVRKGPAAGTGHEGYGSMGSLRRRSGGPGSSARPLPGKRASLEKPVAKDTFLADRMNPVIIAGGTVIENRNTSSELTRMESNTILSYGRRPSTDSKASTVMSSFSRNGSGISLWSSALGRGSGQAPASRRPSDGSDCTTKPTIALRRSVQRFESPPNSPLRLTRPIKTSSVDPSGTMSDESSMLELHSQPSNETKEYESSTKRLKKPRSPRKWNFFSRSKAKSTPDIQSERVTVAVMPVEKKPIAFYAMMDPSEQEGDEEPMNVHTALRQAEVYTRAEIPQSMPSVDLGHRRPRLAQVGRIPQVISSRSFSRPFANDARPLDHKTDAPDGPAGTTDDLPSLSTSIPVPNVVGGSVFTELYWKQPTHASPGPFAANEFFTFSPRKNSDGTMCSSSTDSGVRSYVDATAIIPRPDDPPAEDEIWDEYDDLLGDANGRGGHLSTTSSRGAPFHLEAYRMEFAADGEEAPTHLADVDTDEPRVSISLSSKARQSGSSSSSEEWSPSAQVNLRVGSMTVSKWLTFGHVLFSDVRHEVCDAEEVSERPSILVIDGLGNDDWSFYAAETYPGVDFFNLSPRAPVPTAQVAGSGKLLSPPNHVQIEYHSQLDAFPFASRRFSCVVYRFPAAAPESHFENVLMEARRVLKPGGYIEMSILDVDLNNMGHGGRRAIRQLKERIYGRSMETNLSSAADLVVRLLGREGFCAIKAARVGIPVASNISRVSVESERAAGFPSRASSISRVNMDSEGVAGYSLATGAMDNERAAGYSLATKTQSKKKRKKKLGEQPTLAEMMKDHGPTADESITNMVSRVGRWWYSRCYEVGEESVWSDKALLRECEELGTSLKLMVCYARLPEGTNSF